MDALIKCEDVNACTSPSLSLFPMAILLNKQLHNIILKPALTLINILKQKLAVVVSTNSQNFVGPLFLL